MPKIDDGFQGMRPSDLSGYGATWDAMTSPERRFAFWTDILVGGGGAILLGLLASVLT